MKQIHWWSDGSNHNLAYKKDRIKFSEVPFYQLCIMPRNQIFLNYMTKFSILTWKSKLNTV